jgi:hypothetical protein
MCAGSTYICLPPDGCDAHDVHVLHTASAVFEHALMTCSLTPHLPHGVQAPVFGFTRSGGQKHADADVEPVTPPVTLASGHGVHAAWPEAWA